MFCYVCCSFLKWQERNKKSSYGSHQVAVLSFTDLPLWGKRPNFFSIKKKSLITHNLYSQGNTFKIFDV